MRNQSMGFSLSDVLSSESAQKLQQALITKGLSSATNLISSDADKAKAQELISMVTSSASEGATKSLSEKLKENWHILAVGAGAVILLVVGSTYITARFVKNK